MLNNEKGFTLIEMLIVLLVISVLLIITIPNMAQNSTTIRSKGCEALIKTVEAQGEAYYIDTDSYATSIDILESSDYISTTTCPNGDELAYSDGKVSIVGE
ncbi:competence type IV pilus major pilin ComGC [Halobacillus litoralis]|uniref:competence type IV pilus major pilin ComGC n=1 Tax=Halobacillus TaxID=45667 RepID=UPI00267D30F5